MRHGLAYTSCSKYSLDRPFDKAGVTTRQARLLPVALSGKMKPSTELEMSGRPSDRVVEHLLTIPVFQPD